MCAKPATTLEHIVLIPFGDGEQCLHSIKLVKNEEVIVGRNRTTFHGEHNNFAYISRRHVKIQWSGGDEVLISALTTTPELVRVNDTVLSCTDENPTIAVEGDCLCLMHKAQCFNFKISAIHKKAQIQESPKEILELPKPGSEQKANDDISAVKVDQTDETLISKTECSICLLPLAFAHAVNPCGHHFCYSCIFDWSKVNATCPSCQENVTGMHPAHLLNDIIEGVLSTFDDINILKDWKERLAEGVAQKKRDCVISSTTPAPSPAFHVKNMFSESRKRPHSSVVSTAVASSGCKKATRLNSTSDIVDLTDNGDSSGGRSRSSEYKTPSKADSPSHTGPPSCIAFHIQRDYQGLNTAEVGMPLKQAIDSFDTNAVGLSNVGISLSHRHTKPFSTLCVLITHCI